MGLINLQTNLKSLKYGKDKLGGGSSGQPYIQTPIPDDLSLPPTNEGNDFLYRGGLIGAGRTSIIDGERLTKWFGDGNNGFLFTAKQNLLSRISVKTEATKGLGYAMGTINQGAYTPLSTILQSGVGFLGTHLNFLGLDPSGLLPGAGINEYYEVIKKKTLKDEEVEGKIQNKIEKQEEKLFRASEQGKVGRTNRRKKENRFLMKSFSFQSKNR